MTVGVIVQARVGSTRLPGKVLLPLAGKPVLERVIERVKQIRGVDRIIVATTNKPEDVPLLELALRMGATAYGGSELDVLNRYYKAADFAHLDTVVRITADCPLLDPEVSTRVLDAYRKGGYDYVSNCHPPTFPDGLDTEVFSFKALRKAWLKARTAFEREHVTPHIWRRPYRFRLLNTFLPLDEELTDHRWTLDTQEDYEWISAVYDQLGPTVTTKDILASNLSRTAMRQAVL